MKFYTYLCPNHEEQRRMNKTPNIAVVLAGGSGRRAGGEVPKQFLMLGNRPVIAHSIDAFQQNADIDEIAVVLHPDHVERIGQMQREYGWSKLRQVLTGGAERYHSSMAAIKAYTGREVNLLLHDAARPLLSQEIISSVCSALTRAEAVGVAVDAIDTMVQADAHVLTRQLDRASLRRMQTPQAFRLSLIEEAYAKALTDPDFHATDDCGVVLKYVPQAEIKLVQGNEENMKLTYAGDMPLLENILARRNAAETSLDGTDCHAALRAYQKRHLREAQLRMLDILKAIRTVCDNNNITYWLDSGTLLGAVRHGGFIPWDDDIDICISRKDMPRFVEAAQRELPSGLFVQTPQTDPSVRMPMCKVRDTRSLIVEGADDFSKPYAKGLYVDVFPMEPWPDLPDTLSRRLARNYCKANAILHSQHYYSWRSVAELFYFGAKRAICRCLWEICKCTARGRKWYSNVPENSGNGNRHLASTIFPVSSITFEGEAFSAPADPDQYLRDLFGEYRTLPPEDQRGGHAVFFCTDLNT